MKRILLLILLFTSLNTISNAQINSVGKTETMVTWDILGLDSINRSIYSNVWHNGDTMVVAICRVLPKQLPYNPIYYFVNNICVKQRIIYLKEYCWPAGVESLIVDRVVDYNPTQSAPVNLPSSYYQNQIKTDARNVANDNLPETKPQNNQ